MYTPDGWVLLKIHTEEGFMFKVFASWGGSFVSGDSWKINSGIENTIITDEALLFEGYSGSTYKCYRTAENRITSYNWGVLEGFIKQAAEQGVKLEVVSSEEFLGGQV